MRYYILIISVLLSSLCMQAQNIVGAEYYFNTDPGVGLATPLTITSPGTDLTETFTVSAAGLPIGYHRAFIRVQDDTGTWSFYDRFFFYVSDTTVPAAITPAAIVEAEYYIDTDPGVGMATSLAITTSGLDITETFTVNTTGTPIGFHRVFVRVKDANNVWSLYDRFLFYVSDTAIPAEVIPEDIVAMEYYVDTDPGIGMATAMSVSAPAQELTEQFTVGTTGLTEGYHRLFVRVQNAVGVWSTYDRFLFYVANTTVPDAITPSEVVAAEYFFETDPGFGMATAVTIVPNGEVDGYTFAIDASTLNCGDTFDMHFRVQNADGIWSLYDFKDDLVLEDTIGPYIMANTAITLDLDATGMATLDINDVENGTTDNCSGVDSLALSQTAFTCADLGVNEVIFTATDAQGNTSTETITVTVQDMMAPMATAQDATIALDASGVATVDLMMLVASSSDNCDGELVLTADNLTFTCDNVGANSFTFTVSDTSGNMTNLTTTVTIVDDLAPTIVDCPAADVVEEVATGTAFEVPDYTTTFTVTDNCSGSTLSQTPPAGTLVQIGSSTNVTITAIDAAGNEAICSFNVIVDELLGINESIWSQSVTLYPVPAQEVLNIDSLRAIETVTIIDVLGRVVDTHTMNGATRINVANLAEGSYFVQITSENETVTKRILKSSK